MSAASSIWSHVPAEYAIPESAPSLDDAYSYCERLARSHYENFSVATWFLPKRLRQHFFNVYAYSGFRTIWEMKPVILKPRYNCSINGNRS